MIIHTHNDPKFGSIVINVPLERSYCCKDVEPKIPQLRVRALDAVLKSASKTNVIIVADGRLEVVKTKSAD